MKLSNLVAYLNHLDSFDTQGAQQVLQQHVDPVLHVIKTHDLQFSGIVDRLGTARRTLDTTLSDIDSAILDLKKEIKSNIESMEPKYLVASYNLYSEGMVHDTDQHILERRFALDEASRDYLRARIMRHSDWHYPGMMIRPGLENWIQDLVALDPMYLVDTSDSLLDPCRQRFPIEYQNRLRSYVIKESTEHTMLAKLPQQQMAFVLMYNFLHYKPMELIRCYLQEIYGCLRPGGTLAFTFNNCDRTGGVSNAERFYMCYTPARLILAAAEFAGFEITHVYHIDAASTWVELTKPGKMTNIRGGQTLAKIVTK
jgi:hypothetical protein